MFFKKDFFRKCEQIYITQTNLFVQCFYLLSPFFIADFLLPGKSLILCVSEILVENHYLRYDTLREKSPNTELFSGLYFLVFVDWIQENTDQK